MAPPPGTISDGLECQEMCNKFKELGCQYWVYEQEEQSCTLYDNGERKCSAKGGPNLPPINECNDIN